MGKKTEQVNHRLVIYPQHPGDFGFCHIGGMKRDADETVRILEEMQQQVLRHVDGVRSRNVQIENDIEETCEFCGSAWTEGKSPHNGGCCAKDCEVFEAMEIAE